MEAALVPLGLISTRYQYAIYVNMAFYGADAHLKWPEWRADGKEILYGNEVVNLSYIRLMNRVFQITQNVREIHFHTKYSIFKHLNGNGTSEIEIVHHYKYV